MPGDADRGGVVDFIEYEEWLMGVAAPGDSKCRNRETYGNCVEKASMASRFAAGAETVAEIGVRAGYSAHAFLSVMPAARRYFGYDLCEGTHGGVRTGMEHADRMLRREHPSVFFCFVHADTRRSLFVGLRDVGLFHVDGDHTFSGCLHDMELAWPAVARGGVMVVDDYDYIPDVRMAVDSFVATRRAEMSECEYVKTYRGDVVMVKKGGVGSPTVVGGCGISERDCSGQDRIEDMDGVWEHVDEFETSLRVPVRLPVTSVVLETRPEKMRMLRRVTEWHRKWFVFEREVVVSMEDPGIPGTCFVKCPNPPSGMFEGWYSDFCIRWLDSVCCSDFALVWQWDGFIVNPEMWTDEFMRYDYVGGPVLSGRWMNGAAWLERTRPGWRNPMRVGGLMTVGNGGFSLRSRRFMAEAAKRPMAGAVSTHREDEYLCVERRMEMEDAGVRFCPIELACRFSKCLEEGQDVMGCFGFHDAENFKRVKECLESKYLPRATAPVQSSPPGSV